MDKQLKVILEKTNTGYSAYAPEAKGIFTTGKTFDEIKENLSEVLESQIEYLKETNNREELERIEGANLVFFLDIEQFFEHFNMINKSAFAQYIGINESQLRQISKGLISLTSKKALQIQNGLHNLAKDLKTVHFA